MDDVRNGGDRSDGGDLFTGIDPKLTVFALANGVDLAKGEGYRRLEWFSEGHERAIVIEALEEGQVRVDVLRWVSGNAEDGTRASVSERVAASDAVGLLDQAVEAANSL